MRFWPFGAAVVFLAAVLTSASSSYLLGNMSNAEGKWMTPRPQRWKETFGAKWERLFLSRQKREKLCVEELDGCCTVCPLGTFVQNCTCEICSDGTYLAHNNSLNSCLPCDECDSDAHQVEVEKCTPEHDRQCGCERGFYRRNDHGFRDKYFSCHPCTVCATLNKQTLMNCSEQSDTRCGNCLPNFSLQQNKCREVYPIKPHQGGKPGHQNSAVLTLETERGWQDPFPTNFSPVPDNQGFNSVYLLLCLPCLVLLGALVIYYKRKSTTGESSPADTLLAAAATASSLKHKSEEPMEFPPSFIPSQALCTDPSPHRPLLQGRKMYSVIDVVPVRRWKEFMRGLGLRDGEIEAVEVEHTQLREQQYEMLKRWRQQQGATMEAIFAVLEDMQLGGCAQELREQWQLGDLPPSL